MSASRTAGLQLMTAFLAVLCASIFLVGCSGGANSTAASLTPAFTSTPGTTASQGATYTYQIVTAPAESVTLALITGPSGATLNEKTLTWTPSAAQSRISNQFLITATNAARSASQSWSVTPAGTVSGTWIDTYWTSNGPVSVPFDWSKALTLIPPRAFIPQPDGSFQTLQGTGNSDGTFSIPNVPGGYYWLAPAASAYWTSSSTFDFGSNVNPAPSGPADLTNNTTTMTLNFSGLDPLQTGDDVAFFWDSAPPFTLVSTAASPAGATSFSTTATINSNLDFSQTAPAFLLQYEPENLGALSALMLGPELTIPSLTFTGGTSKTLTQSLSPLPKASFDVNIKGSAWVPLFSNVGPSSATLEKADLELTTQPFVTGANVLSTFGTSIPLFGDLQPFPALFSAVCTSSLPRVPNFSTSPPGEPTITTDQDFGRLQYEDPFPPAWPRVFTFCQTASVPVPIPGSTTPILFQLVDAQRSSLATSPISPLIGQVQDPTINGMSLFVAGSVGATGATLKWTAPSGTTPTGYKITAFTAGALANGVISYLPGPEFYTAKTSALLPLLQAGKTYVFLITAILDEAANFESQPNRSALPTASVSVISAPITIQ
jgi:hypothetical protein